MLSIAKGGAREYSVTPEGVSRDLDVAICAFGYIRRCCELQRGTTHPSGASVGLIEALGRHFWCFKAFRKTSEFQERVYGYHELMRAQVPSALVTLLSTHLVAWKGV